MEKMKFLDIRYSDDCPNCGQNLYHFIWDKDNVLSVSALISVTLKASIIISLI